VCPVAGKTKSQPPTPAVRKPRPNPRTVPSAAEVGLPCGSSAEIRAVAAAALAKLDAEPSTQSYDQSATITTLEMGGLEAAFAHFNRDLLGGALPDTFITLRARANSFGYFSPDRFVSRDGLVRKGEIALNPDAFPERTDKLICSTLAHDMVHALQHVRGSAPKSHYHNAEWAQMMRSIGLQPTSTGLVGGRETGQHMSHLIVPGGPFELSFHRLETAGWRLNLQSASAHSPKDGPKKNKVKVTCPECGQNAWGKPDLAVTCSHCGTPMPSAELAAADL
jgi:ribosomal protein S27E